MKRLSRSEGKYLTPFTNTTVFPERMSAMLRSFRFKVRLNCLMVLGKESKITQTKRFNLSLMPRPRYAIRTLERK